MSTIACRCTMTAPIDPGDTIYGKTASGAIVCVRVNDDGAIAVEPSSSNAENAPTPGYGITSPHTVASGKQVYSFSFTGDSGGGTLTIGGGATIDVDEGQPF